MTLYVSSDGISYSTDITTANRPATVPSGFLRFNNDSASLELRSGGTWRFIGAKDGSSYAKAAPSAVYLKNTIGINTSGTYWINVNGTPKQLYCDMTTDGGGWILIMEVQNQLTDTGEVSSGNLSSALHNLANSKLSDADIRYLAKYHSNYEWSMRKDSTVYICRYNGVSGWDSWASGGATNLTYASKASNGTWTGYIYNGHYNNRGFSTYSDNNNSACPTTFSGGSYYTSQHHTAGYSDGAPFSIYVR